MKITSARTVCVGNPWKNWLFVIVETDEGVTGLGEATSGLSTKPIEAGIKELEPLFLGLNPLDVTGLHEALVKGLYLQTSPALAGLELACWDILGKHLGVPVWQLLGGRIRDRIPAYANGWYQGPREAGYFAQRAAEVVESGYRALKFDPFGEAYGHLDRAEMRLSMDIVGAVRDNVPDDVELMIEAHDRFDVGTAIQVGKALGGLGISWLEAPVLSTDAEALRSVVNAVPVPVAAGERCSYLHEFARLADAGIAVAQPEVLNYGLLTTLRMAAIAQSRQIPVAPHNAQSPYTTAVNLHLAAVVPNFLIQEHFDDFGASWTHEVLRGTVVRDGADLLVPERPGFGVELDEQVAAKYPYSPQNFLRLFRSGWERRNSDRP